MERHFSCTACGKCCYGLLPLTIDDALAHADKFPLVVIWTPVRQGGRSFRVTADLGITIELKKRKLAAVRIAPTAYIPPTFSCPELTDEGLCAIHAAKPQRCRTMPFSAYRDEKDQDDLMIPRSGWVCDTSDEAPVVYRDKRIIGREDFAGEREQLVRDAAILKPYAEWLLDSVPSLRMELQKLAMKPGGGRVVVAFSTLIPRLPKVDIYAFAEKQLPVMQDFAQRTARDPALADYHRRYVDCAAEWEQITRRRP
ncbi:MAG: YkgJ family cysteine cluster protein [Rhodospirillales bacterium]|nr:YkgJ family cysteine cluster protein [Rhodospirillales bacterium]